MNVATMTLPFPLPTKKLILAEPLDRCGKTGHYAFRCGSKWFVGSSIPMPASTHHEMAASRGQKRVQHGTGRLALWICKRAPVLAAIRPESRARDRHLANDPLRSIGYDQGGLRRLLCAVGGYSGASPRPLSELLRSASELGSGERNSRFWEDEGLI
jgi:hypothetical protein